MFKKNNQIKDLNQQEISTIIGLGFTITGELKGKAVIRIDGTVIGNVNVEGGIVLGEKGMIKGDIQTASAIIYGTVNGNVKTQNLEIKKTGRVNGDIKTEAIEIELGAQYNGKLEMHQSGKTEDKVAIKA
ncbi:polymer-forming cytoskeletal protein [Pedobacter sp. ISL-68]|uniref:bactofilin family protein n=1 Tax=unclassified Pedobacter TaxID=2628915 RepID=UPI001BEC3AB6|nr:MULTISPECIES: polymer-forming cytoskeletal protein [unclassified Pedobacter]MBT2560398.1 polymer-forming cytoskeletal protein [Pedobacter sp. ISL-64]MBT2589378.1 polymer-forming cytoskeletal protein [Pedobacter sp. ISL-68]